MHRGCKSVEAVVQSEIHDVHPAAEYRGFIKRMHDDEYGYIRQRVQEAMGFAGGAGEGQKEVHALKAENEKLRKQLHESELARQREKEEVMPYKRMYYDLWDRYTKRG